VVVDEGWSRLPEHWQCAFRQAWAAYVAGTIPVGAVVVDPHGVVAAEARNRIFDAGDPPRGQLAGSWLAHAELNTIAQIDAERSTTAEGWAVYSTWEPCPLCKARHGFLSIYAEGSRPYPIRTSSKSSNCCMDEALRAGRRSV